jgi:hypothetical protein
VVPGGLEFYGVFAAEFWGVGGEFQFVAENQRFGRLALRAIVT